jgi:hypothetical protein
MKAFPTLYKLYKRFVKMSYCDLSAEECTYKKYVNVLKEWKERAHTFIDGEISIVKDEDETKVWSTDSFDGQSHPHTMKM